MRLDVRRLACGYGEKTVVHGVSLAVERGEIVCLLGANGSGKTTFFKTVLGLLRPQGGDVLLGGENLSGWSPAKRARVIGYVPQAREMAFPFRAFDVALMGRTCHTRLFSSPSRKDRHAAEEALEAMGVRHLRDRPFTELSGGEQQLVLLARALTQEPRVLVMDEPTTSLDFGKQILVLDRIRMLARMGIGVLLSTHFPEHAFLCAHRVMGFSEGRLLGLGKPTEVITAENVKAMYGVDVDIVSLGEAYGNAKLCVPRGARGQ